MSQNLFVNASVKVAPALVGGSVGNGTLTIDKLTHFTINQVYSAVCTGIDPFTVFNIVGDKDGPVGVAIVGQQFVDSDIKIFLTINQGPNLFEVGDTFNFEVEQGTDLTQENLDAYDELPQKNFGTGIIGENKGNHNIRFFQNSQLASKTIQSLKFESKVAGSLGNLIAIEYKLGGHLTAAYKVIQDLTFTAQLPGQNGNLISIEYENYTPAVKASKVIQDLQFFAKNAGANGNLISIIFLNDGVAGSEGVSVAGNQVTVHIQSGVSTADNIKDAIGSHIQSYNLLDGYVTGTGSETQVAQAETFLLGGANAIGDAGHEVVTVIGNAIKIKLQSGASTAQQVLNAFNSSPEAIVLASAIISGVANTVQTAPIVQTYLANGSDEIGAPNNEFVQVINNEIAVTFISGQSTAQMIKTAIENNVAANALVSVSIVGLVGDFQTSPVAKSYLGGGLGQGTFSLNTKELTDPSNFREGNAQALITGLNNQGDEQTSGTTYKNGRVELNNVTVGNDSGPSVYDNQKTINNLIQNGKCFITTTNDEKVLWSKPFGTLECDGDIKFIFPENGIINTILSSNFPLNIPANHHVYVLVNRKINSNLTPIISATVPNSPNGEDVFRLVSAFEKNLIWYDNTLQREGKKIRIGEGASSGAWQEKLGVGNGIQKTFVIPSGLIPFNETSILVFSSSVSFLNSDWNYIEGSNAIFFNTEPELGQEIYIFFLTDGDSITVPSPVGTLHSYVHTISAMEDIAKELQLIAQPFQPSKILVDIIGGGAQIYEEDFGINLNMFVWSGYALDGLLETGDKIRFRFYS